MKPRRAAALGALAPWGPGSTLAADEADLAASAPDRDHAAWMRHGDAEKAAGRWATAEASFGLALRTALSRRGGAFTDDTIGAARQLALVRQAAGRYEDARSLQLELRRRLRGPHAAAQRSAITLELAESSCHACRYAEAMKLQRSVLAERRRRLGDDNAETAEAKIDLGGTLMLMNDHAPSLGLLREAVDTSTHLLGPQARQTLRAQHALGGLLWTTNDLEGACRMYEDVVATARRIEVPIDELLCYEDNLAAVLTRQERYAQARAVLEHVVERRTAWQGRWNSYTLSARVNLAWNLRALGDAAGARDVCEADLAGCAERLGPGHMLTFAFEAVLADALQDLGEDEALHALAIVGISRVRHTTVSTRNLFARHAFYMRVLARQG